ncbi:MAG: POT family MFS transporter [Oligoflexia bacterium]|nr:POT family MFS transporter [Oligoflexia bacterium]
MGTVATQDKLPPQIKYIIGNEAAERFSFYGMRSILTVFMINQLMFVAADAKATYHLFVSACYLTPLLGAYISDRFWGKYKTIMYISLLYCVGHGVLAMWETKQGLYAGLALIALGAGGIKPCVSAHVGDQFNEKNKHLVKGVFDIFYFSINFGSFFSTLMIPWVLPRYGSGWAFGIPGILMAIATFVFWLGRKQYVIVPPTGKTGDVGLMPIVFYAMKNQAKRKTGESYLDVAKNKYTEEQVAGAKAAINIFKVFASCTAFWALFDQHGSSWVLQAQQMDLNVLGIQFEASQISALNPIMVMLLIPFFAYVVNPLIEKVFKIKMTPLRRMSLGMILAAFSFVFVGILQIPLDQGQKISVAWQFIPYLIITMSEVLISITGLEFAYSQAPRSMKSTIMSFWFLTIFAGNLITAYVSKINVFEGATFFFFFAALMGVLSLVFVFMASRYKVRDYYEKAT